MSFIAPALSIGTRSFAPGFLDTPESDTLPDGAMVDGRNAWFHSVDLDGSRRRATSGKRPGSRLLTPTGAGVTLRCDGLVNFTQEANPSQLIGAWGGGWYRWDEFDALVAIPTATGYVAGNPARAELFKNQAFLYDGSKQQLYDGLSARDVGFVKPTGVTAMTAGASPGVTGTYAAKYLWFDQVHNHESSISDDATASLALVDQARVHTKPTGAPPAHVTHWRVYVRRVDTDEAYYMRVGTVPIADATFTEAIVDGARKDKAPLPNENDPPTVPFKVAVAYKGFFIGFPDGSSDMHVSKQGDCESYNPANIFKVGPGDGRPVRSAKTYGTQCVVQKPNKSFLLVGSALPFDIEPIHSGWGNVSQDAAIEVEGRLYAWDQTKGPYWTDLQNWVSLVDGRIETFLQTIGLTDVADIRVEHDEVHSLIVWLVPTFGSPRKRTALLYHYGLDAWLPPMTGFEYAALRSYLTHDGTIRLVMGDYWGRLWSLFQGHRDAPTTGTVSGTATSATHSTLVDSAGAFYVTGDGLAGVPVAVRDPATGLWQWRRIASNTGTTLTLDTTFGTSWSSIPTTGWRYIIGGIEWWQLTPWMDGGTPLGRKKACWLELQTKPTADDIDIQVVLRFDDNSGSIEDREVDLTAETNASLWGVALWGTAVWSTISRRARKVRVGRTFQSLQMALGNYEPDQPVIVTGYAIGADPLSRATVPGGDASSAA